MSPKEARRRSMMKAYNTMARMWFFAFLWLMIHHDKMR